MAVTKNARSWTVVETKRTILQLIEAKKIPTDVAIEMLSYVIINLSHRIKHDSTVDVTE